MGNEAVKAALEEARAAIESAIAACEGEHEDDESLESPAEEGSEAPEVGEDAATRKKTIAAVIKKNLYK